MSKQVESIWQNVRVDARIMSTARDNPFHLTFTGFGTEFMVFLKGHAFQYEGSVVATNGTVELDGRFNIPRRLSDDEFWDMLVQFCEQRNWRVGGLHRLGD